LRGPGPGHRPGDRGHRRGRGGGPRDPPAGHAEAL
ncbi:MAG: hypothetical protein AVDCRST_MAG33-883, partial [uncultured Thermomicrobiales bacterium]